LGSLIFINGKGIAQNVKILHYNLFTTKNTQEVKTNKDYVTKNIITNIQSDIYSFSENANKKSMLDRHLILQDVNQTQYKSTGFNTSNFYHYLVYNSYKLQAINVQNIYLKNKPIILYRLNYLSPNIENRIINCFIIRPENTGEQLVKYLDKISIYIMEKNLDGYNIIIGGTNNIQIQDKRILGSSQLAYQNNLSVVDLTVGEKNTNINTISSIVPNFDMAFVIKKKKNKRKNFQIAPNSYTLLTKNRSSFYVEVNEDLIDTMMDISAHIPLYFELEPLRHIKPPPKKRLSYNELVIEDLTLTFNWKKEELIYIQLRSIIGNIVYQTSFICPTTEYQVNIPMNSLATGHYYIKLTTSEEEIRKPVQKVDK